MRWLLFLVSTLICCDSSTTVHKLGATGSTASPIIPASWLVPAWFIDPANSSGNASDNNSCTSSGTPCLSYAEISVHRWGTISPRLQQSTTITWMSSESGSSPDVFRPIPDQGSYVILMGSLGAAQQVASGTITLVAAKNRTTPQLLSVTLPVPIGTYAAGQLVVNLTHQSRAWLYKIVSGNTWLISQPLAPAVLPMAYFTPPPEVDTWATIDSVVVYQPISVNLGEVNPDLYDSLSSFVNGVFVYQLNIQPSPFNTLGLPAFIMGGEVDFVESSSNRAIGTVCPTHSEVSTLVNVYDAVRGVTGVNAQNIFVFGGVHGNLSAGPMEFDEDAILANGGNTSSASGPAVFGGPTYIESGPSAVGTVGYTNIGTDGGFAGLTPSVWGPGRFRAFGTVNYAAGAGGAAATFIGPIVLQANGGTIGCVDKPSTGRGLCGVTINVTNLDTNLGATTGCISVPNGGAFCNYTGGP